MTAAAKYCAFLGDPARKAEMVERVRAQWEQRLAFPLTYLKWRTDGGMVSLSGTLAQTQVPEEFVERTGLPVELGALCEGLVYSGAEFVEDKGSPRGLTIRGAEAILGFAMEWLDAIPVGADLGDVVPRFMYGFLTEVLASDFAMAAHLSPAVRGCAERILGLWERELCGGQVPPKDWRSLRAEALRASEDHGDPWGFALSELVESLAWPASSLAPEFVPIFQLFVKEFRQFLLVPYLSIEDREVVKRALVGLRELTRVQRDPQLSQLPAEALQEQAPASKQAVVTFMREDTQARLDAAKQQAKSASDLSLRRQMDTLRGLIEAA